MNEAEAMKRDRQIDRILFSRWAGIPLMILLLCLVLWITLAGANIPSQMLAEFLFSLEAPLAEFLTGAASAGCHRHDAERGDVPGISLGGRGYASADGDLLPVVYLS